MSFIIFKSFAYFYHLFLCFMSAYTLEVNTRNYKDPKILLLLYETMNYKSPKTMLSLYETMNYKWVEGVVIIVRDNDLYKDPKML